MQPSVPRTRALAKFERLAETHSQTEIAERLGVRQQSVSAWLRQRARPATEVRDRIEHEFGIDRRDWYSPEERRLASGRSDAEGRVRRSA